MNAPWKPTPGNRDPFAAFICDEAALDTLRPVVIELGWQPEKCAKGGLRNAVQSLSVAASPTAEGPFVDTSTGPLVCQRHHGGSMTSAAFLAALCAFLFVVALVVFITVPGPDTLGTLLRTSPLAGAVLVVAVLLVLANPAGSLRWLWVVAAVAAAAWTAFAVWDTRRSGG